MKKRRNKSEMSLQNKILLGLGSVAGISGLALLFSGFVKSSQTKQEEKKTLVQGSNETYAKQIRMALLNEGKFGIDMESLREVVRSIPTKEDVEATKQSYLKNFHIQMPTDMGNYLSTTEYKEVLAILDSKPSKGKAVPMQQKYLDWAKRLKAAFDYTWAGGLFDGTDIEAVKAVFIEIPTQADFKNVAKVYQQQYGSDLEDDLDSEEDFFDDDLMEIINRKRK